MVKKTVNERAREIPESKKRQISGLIGRGESIVEICQRLNLDYSVVQAFLWQEGTLPWQGAKTIITRRLKKSVTARRQENRERLADEIREQVDYLYYAAKQLSSQLGKVKRSLKPLP